MEMNGVTLCPTSKLKSLSVLSAASDVPPPAGKELGLLYLTPKPELLFHTDPDTYGDAVPA